jgi:hypothetical protein
MVRDPGSHFANGRLGSTRAGISSPGGRARTRTATGCRTRPRSGTGGRPIAAAGRRTAATPNRSRVAAAARSAAAIDNYLWVWGKRGADTRVHQVKVAEGALYPTLTLQGRVQKSYEAGASIRCSRSPRPTSRNIRCRWRANAGRSIVHAGLRGAGISESSILRRTLAMSRPSGSAEELWMPGRTHVSRLNAPDPGEQPQIRHSAYAIGCDRLAGQSRQPPALGRVSKGFLRIRLARVHEAAVRSNSALPVARG